MAVLKGADRDVSHFFPNIEEEIFIVDKAERQIINYAVVCDLPETAMINMTEGSMAVGRRQSMDSMDDDQGYASQEVFTQEKFIYLYYQGLLLLEFMYKNGISHGHISASTLRISEDYSFSLADFAISTFVPGFVN